MQCYINIISFHPVKFNDVKFFVSFRKLYCGL